MGMFSNELEQYQVDQQTATSDKSWLISILGLAVSLLSLILAQFQKQQARFWGVIGVGTVTALVGVYQPLTNLIRKLLRTVHNCRVVRKNKKEFCRLSRQAGIFLDTGYSRNDVLAGIPHDISLRHSELVLASKIPHPGIFHDHWNYLHGRICAGHLSPRGFHDSAEELFSLLRSYTTFSVLPLFHLFAAEYRESLNDNDKSKMNAFQQQYISFLGTYAAFLSRLNDEFQGMSEFHTAMAKPQPL